MSVSHQRIAYRRPFWLIKQRVFVERLCKKLPFLYSQMQSTCISSKRNRCFHVSRPAPNHATLVLLQLFDIMMLNMLWPTPSHANQLFNIMMLIMLWPTPSHAHLVRLQLFNIMMMIMSCGQSQPCKPCSFSVVQYYDADHVALSTQPCKPCSISIVKYYDAMLVNRQIEQPIHQPVSQLTRHAHHYDWSGSATDAPSTPPTGIRRSRPKALP